MNPNRVREIEPTRLEKLHGFCLEWDLDPTPEMLAALEEAHTSVPYGRANGVRHNRWLEWRGDAAIADAVSYLLGSAPELAGWSLEELETARLRLCSASCQRKVGIRIGVDYLLLVPDDFQPYAAGKKVIDRSVLVADAVEAIAGAIQLVQPHKLLSFVETCMVVPWIERESSRRPFPFSNTWREVDPLPVPQSRAEWVGAFVARLVVTLTILSDRARVDVYKAHRLREEAMRLLRKSMALTALAFNLTTPNQPDSTGVRVLLSAFGKAHEEPNYTDLVTQIMEPQELVASAHISLRERRELPTHMVALAVFMHDSPHPIVVDRQGQRTTIYCNGIELGSAVNSDPARAQDDAARLALNHDALPGLRDSR